MSMGKMQKVRIIFDEIKKMKGFTKDTELATWLGVKKQTLWGWESRGRIADYKPFVARGLSEDWMRTGLGEMMAPGGTVVHGVTGHIDTRQDAPPIIDKELLAKALAAVDKLPNDLPVDTKVDLMDQYYRDLYGEKYKDGGKKD